MSDVKQFDNCDVCGGMVLRRCGGYVSIEEFKAEHDELLALQQRLSAAEQELATIKAQAEDATEYVLALENKALRAKLAATRAAADRMAEEIDRHRCIPTRQQEFYVLDDAVKAYRALAAEGTTGEG